MSGKPNDPSQISDVQRDTSRVLFSHPPGLVTGTLIIDEMKPITGTGSVRILKVSKGTKGFPDVETISIRSDQAGDMHRHTSTFGNLFKAGDPRVLFADIDMSITNALRGLVADDRCSALC